ncbi:MAG: choline dehydrogenase [Pseudomonadota bacterium]
MFDVDQVIEADYVIVGAGSAGCVLANRLGADAGRRIIVLEAGPPDRDLMIHVPAGVHAVWCEPKLNWNYLTDPEPTLDDRLIDMPRGKVVGGSSSINSMVYMRGHPLDYDAWSQRPGLAHWRYADCLPYFKAGETSDRGADAWRGSGGPLGVTRGRYDNPLYDAFLAAGAQAGQGATTDPNGFDPEGVARLDATRWRGRRCSAAVAHLRPALRRGNVRLLTRALVERVLFDGRRAVGVRAVCRGRTLELRAGCDVILAAGAINSPQLLMLSGVGERKQLERHGIACRAAVPAVGQHLQDHASVIVQTACTRAFPVHKVDHPVRKALAGARWLFARDGVAASNIWEAGGLIRSTADAAYPDLQYHFGPVGFSYEGKRIALRQAFALHVDQLRPRSRGAVTLRSANPADKPHMQFHYLSHPLDLSEMVSGVRRALELIAQPAFDALRGPALDPISRDASDADIVHWIRATATTDFHPCGTCRMGVGEDCVVDPNFAVHGVEGLRVVDASVMPRIVSGNLNAPTQMIAARAADTLNGVVPLPPEQARFAFVAPFDTGG